MQKREKEYVEFRYYEIPQRVPLIALMGERWVRGMEVILCISITIWR